MVRACRPPARARSGSGVARRSTMTTSTLARASSAASISPVGPPPAITTACSVIRCASQIRQFLTAAGISVHPTPGDRGYPGGPQAGAATSRLRRVVQRLELLEQRPQFLAHLYLSEKDADGTVRVDEEVCAQSAGPADPAALGSRCLDGHAKTPPHAVPETREEAVRGLASRRHLVAGQFPQMIRRN